MTKTDEYTKKFYERLLSELVHKVDNAEEGEEKEAVNKFFVPGELVMNNYVKGWILNVLENEESLLIASVIPGFIKIFTHVIVHIFTVGVTLGRAIERGEVREWDSEPQPKIVVGMDKL